MNDIDLRIALKPVKAELAALKAENLQLKWMAFFMLVVTVAVAIGCLK